VNVPRQRQIPPFAPETFKAWFGKRNRPAQGGTKVLLWADTFNNYFMPETAQAAVDVLEHAGYEVIVPEEHLCCGRPLYDYGFLEMAASYLRRNLVALSSHIKAETPMVILEPSCCSVFRDEMRALLPESAAANELARNTFTLSEFLEKRVPGYQPPQLKRRAIVQGHCHHKAIMRLKEEKSLMDKMDLDCEVLQSGCCGMAGSFGYEHDKYAVSVACGERALLPRVRQEQRSTIIMADGFSCKEQIAQQTDRQALHLAEVMQMALHQGPNGPDGSCPEEQTVRSREIRINKSMIRSALVTAGLLLAAGVLGVTWLRRKD
jgi:Fe-S oxidoreductase